MSCRAMYLAQHLWDEVVMTPKTEEAIADYLSNRLQERLLAASATVLREVQTRRPGRYS